MWPPLPPCISLQDSRRAEVGAEPVFRTEEVKLIEMALANLDLGAPDRWERIARTIPGRSAADVMCYYNDLEIDTGFIEAGLVPVPRYGSLPPSLDDGDGSDGGLRCSSTFKSAQERRNTTKARGEVVPWTEDEHRLFLMGLKKNGMGELEEHLAQLRDDPDADAGGQTRRTDPDSKINRPEVPSNVVHSTSDPWNEDLKALDRLYSIQRYFESGESSSDDVVTMNNEYLREDPKEIPGEKRFLSNTFDLLTAKQLPCALHGFWKKDDPGLGWGIWKENEYKAMKRTFLFHKKHQPDMIERTKWVMNVYFLFDNNRKVKSDFYLCHVFQSDDYEPRPKCLHPSGLKAIDPKNYPINEVPSTGTVSGKHRKRRRSNVWKEFTAIEAPGFYRKESTLAICNHCCMVYGPGSTNGTKTLINHTKVCNHQGHQNCRFDVKQVDSPLDEVSKGIGLLTDIEQYEDLPQDYDCTSKDLLAIEYLMSAPETKRLVDINNAFAQKTDMKCLIEPNTYLSGIVLNVYISCIRSQQYLDNRDGGKVFLEDTFYSTMLKENGQHVPKDDDDAGIFLVDRVEKYLEYDMVFLPINIENQHWYLAVINAAKRKIQVLDSLCWTSRRNELYQTLKGLEYTFNVLVKQRYCVYQKWKDHIVTTWEFDEHLPIAIQRDKVSCGLFMLKFMEYWTGDKLSHDITQDDMSKFRIKLAAVLIRWKTNKAKLTSHVEDVSDTGNISDCEPIDSAVGQKTFTNIRAAKPSKPFHQMRKRHCSVLNVVSFMSKQELVNGVCNYIRSIDDANTLEKEWVRNSRPYPISLSLQQIKDILNENNFMDTDCFNMGIRKMAWDELQMFKEKNEIHVSRHYMDLQFCMVPSLTHGGQHRVQPDAQQLATLLDGRPEIEPSVPSCKMIFVPISNCGMFTLYVLDLDLKTVFILDPNYIQPGIDKEKQKKGYTLYIIQIASSFRLAMREKYPGYDEDIYFNWSHKVAEDVPTNQGALSGYLTLLFMRAWNGERLRQPVCNDGYELRKQFLLELLMFEGNECKENIHDGVGDILKCIKNIDVGQRSGF